METGKIKCERCNGRRYKRVRVYYRESQFYYYAKCWKCYGKGYLDWIQVARGRKPGFAGLFVDSHPAGSVRAFPPEFGGYQVYDGLKYISIETERGKAIWNELVSPIIDEE